MSFNFSPPTHVSLVRRLPAAFPPCRGDSLCEREPPPHPQENARGGSPLDSRTFLLESPLRNTRPCNGAAKPRFHRLSTWSAPISAQPLVQCGFVPLCNLSPLCRSCTSGTKTHVSSVRNPTAERQRPQEARQIESRAQLSMHSSAQRVQHRHSRDGQWQVKGAALAVLGVPKGAILPLRMAPFAGRQRPPLANRQRASALLICCAALGTPRAAPRKAGSLLQRDHPLLAVRGRQPF